MLRRLIHQTPFCGRGMAEPMDYASAGVDIDLEGSAVASLIASLGRSTRQPGTPGAPVDLPGGFGGLIEFGESLLALATDGVGSKLQIASALNQWGGVGIDCMAMNVNDLLCVGAEQLHLLIMWPYLNPIRKHMLRLVHPWPKRAAWRESPLPAARPLLCRVS